MYGSKKVNVYPALPIYTVCPPIINNKFGVSLTTGDIRSCIVARARVEEVLSDGTRLTLNFSNYDKDNSGLVKNKPTETTVKPVVTPEPAVKESIVEKTDESKEEPVETKEELITEEVKEEVVESTETKEEPVGETAEVEVETTKETNVNDFNSKKGKSNKVRYNKQ